MFGGLFLVVQSQTSLSAVELRQRDHYYGVVPQNNIPLHDIVVVLCMKSPYLFQFSELSTCRA